jgi:hypothetical protein
LSTIASTQTHAKFKLATQKRSKCGIGCSGKISRERDVVAIVNLQQVMTGSAVQYFAGSFTDACKQRWLFFNSKALSTMA